MRRHLAPLRAAGADVVILGCTHYQFLRPVIEAEAGPDVVVIDTAEAVARHLEARLDAESLRRAGDGPGETRFLTSGDLPDLEKVLPILWPEAASSEVLPAAVR